MTDPTNLLELYSGDDLENLFKGGFINFGYWNKETLSKTFLTEEDVIRANIRLYDEIFKQLKFEKTDNVLEVGSGYGSGSAYLSSLSCTHSVTGIDYFQKHVDISINRNSNLISRGCLKYIHGEAEKIPFDAETFDKLYTIEAFQHFNVTKSVSEFSRVLKKDGKFVISTFFVKDKQYMSDVLSLIPRPAVLSDFGDDGNAAIPDFLTILQKYFREIEVKSIGEHVWAGYNKWVYQREPGIWDKNWLIAYNGGLLDYYIITGSK